MFQYACISNGINQVSISLSVCLSIYLSFTGSPVLAKESVVQKKGQAHTKLSTHADMQSQEYQRGHVIFRT